MKCWQGTWLRLQDCRGPKKCLLDRLTRLVYVLHLKNLQPSFSNLFSLSTYLAIIVLEFESSVSNNIMDLGVFMYGKVQGSSFQPPKSKNPQKMYFVVQKISMNSVQPYIFRLHRARKQSSQRRKVGGSMKKEQRIGKL